MSSLNVTLMLSPSFSTPSAGSGNWMGFGSVTSLITVTVSLSPSTFSPDTVQSVTARNS